MTYIFFSIKLFMQLDSICLIVELLHFLNTFEEFMLEFCYFSK